MKIHQQRQSLDASKVAVRGLLARTEARVTKGTLKDLQPEPYPEGTERLSEETDAVVYGDGA